MGGTVRSARAAATRQGREVGRGLARGRRSSGSEDQLRDVQQHLGNSPHSKGLTSGTRSRPRSFSFPVSYTRQKAVWKSKGRVLGGEEPTRGWSLPWGPAGRAAHSPGCGLGTFRTYLINVQNLGETLIQNTSVQVSLESKCLKTQFDAIQKFMENLTNNKLGHFD